MTLSEELAWRGFVNQYTFADIKELDNETRTFYWGVDPSADSMTIGNLAAAMMVRHFIDYGYKPILLVGGATGLIGDPDGKKQERDLKTVEEVEKNVQGLSKQYETIFAGKNFEIVNNYDWFCDIGYMQFLREIGKHVSLTQMLDREFVQSRIGEGGAGISYAEFSYALIQGYDFLHLYREKGATLQVAGADQWGNSITGVSLIRRLEGAEAHVYTAPLVINKQTGVKFGKSEGGAVWLDPAKTSPYKFYQFWLNLDDETSEDMIKIYTLLDRATVEKTIADHRENPGARLLQKTLAREVTDLIHGRERRESVERVTAVLFGGDAFATLKDADLDALGAEIPTAPVGSSVIDTLTASGLVASNGEAKRLIANNAISINGQKIADDMMITERSLVKKGKNNFVLVR
ncbi:tyrosine--tRNA ligase [Candidatus Saccharibacteria bacterium oral taxon 955]|nr:tyrosine--tRNA ligase [Candidatus Saccharibacteria bacterium oral taxon 955]QJU05915.1 tyrosine--tRNA ligase [Candidatus Saccharibacteria bacterium oral taxon 955]